MNPARALPVLLALAIGCAGDGPRRGTTEPTPPSFVPLTADNRPVEPAAAPVSVPAPDPVLIPGDLLAISVFRQPDLQLEVRIPQDGQVTFPLVGAVPAAGRTSSQMERVLRERLEKDYLHEAHVTVTVKEYARRRIYMVGGVAKPGGIEVVPHQRLTLLQAVAACEGFTDRAYKEFCSIVRRKSATEREVIRLSLVDVERRVARGHAEADLELWPDDLVVIPSAVRVAYILGAVNKPGTIEVPNDARVTVSMAVSQAGSYTKFASTGRLQVLRTSPSGETQRIPVDLDAVLNGSLDQDVMLLPGDVVWVPERSLF